MGKYEPLGRYLRQQTARQVPMRFSDIERLLGAAMPPSSRQHRAWWSNNPSNNVMTKEWLDAGYETESVDLEAERLVFRRVGSRSLSAASVQAVDAPSGGKYRALGVFLRNCFDDEIAMSFAEIEAVIGSALPASKIYPAWWSNNPGNNTMTKEWLDAGFRTEAVDTQAGRLVFRRVVVRAQAPVRGRVLSDADLPDHPIWGSMAGTLTVKPGVDLTEPMPFEWSGTLYND